MRPSKLCNRLVGARIIRATMNGHDRDGRGRVLRMLQAANGNERPPTEAAVAPGPFELPQPSGGPGLALITGLLVVYPVFATLAITIASFWFLDGGPGA